MINYLKSALMKQQIDRFDYYYRGFGDRIKRKRKDLNMTQEALAYGICSNTYVSKIENNKIPINKDSLYLLMERVGLPTKNVSFPESMLEYLEKATKYFYFKDLEAYKKLYKKISQYEFGILIYVVRFGYHILNEDIYNAKIIYEDIFSYLNTLESIGFSTFIVFSIFYNILIQDYLTARIIIEKVEDKMQNNHLLEGLYYYSRFLVYGNLQLFNKSRDSLNIAKQVFYNDINIVRTKEIHAYLSLFHSFEENNHQINLEINKLDDMTSDEKNKILLMISMNSKNPLRYLNEISKNGKFYLASLFLKALHLKKINDLKSYNEIKAIINNHHYNLDSELDYFNLLKLFENKDKFYLKDYLANYVLPYAISKQNIFVLKYVLQKISSILIEKKRYKDAISYLKKYDDLKLKYQTFSNDII